ncbi:uncharacterized protein [Polyergus mexicanus]|uniref:uncharacterized protein n=1 Tax=Polyergus mexicanus TaxID=615972 RepID=UPI0038B4653F
MTDNTRSLVQKRATIKAQLTRFNTYIESWADHPDEQQLTERLHRIKLTWDVFDDVQSKIESKDEGGNNDNERDLFEESYFNSVARARRILDSLRPPVVRDNVPGVAIAPAAQNGRTNIKLPTINLPTFNGKYEDWLGFYDNFKSIVHENGNITPVQKLQYLRLSLTDEAAHVIQALETSPQNYEIAWGLLTERYDNKRVIIQSHVRALFELPAITKESSAQLRSLVDSAFKHTRALHALGQPTISWDALLFQLITSKLDRNTHKEWEHSLNGTQLPPITEFWNLKKNCCDVLESIAQDSSNQSFRNQSRSNNNRFNTNQKLQQTLVATQSKSECALCRKNHGIFSCEKFTKMNPEARSATVKSFGLCYNCLRPNHLVSDCKSGTCRKCKRKHHTLLHFESDARDQESADASSAIVKSSASLHSMTASQVLLATALVHMFDEKRQPITCRVLLDNGSQSNFITEKLCGVLNLSKKGVDIPVSGFNQALTHIKHSVSARMQSRDGRFGTKLSFLVVSQITDILPAQLINRHELNLSGNITLADSDFCNPSEIDALIGAELFYQLLCVGQIRIRNTSLVLQKTRLGWIVSGALRQLEPTHTACNIVVDSLNSQVAKFWEIEELPSGKHLSNVEKACKKHFIETSFRDPSGRYVVRLPFNDKKCELGDSYQIAKKRLYSLERRLNQDPQTREEYSKFMHEYKTLGHMTEVFGSDATEGGYFIPHHPVFKQDSQTTKLRVVFDASSKSSTGASLNDTLLVGPTIQENLFAIVMRFRTHRYVLSADIEKMYRQVRIHSEDAKFQKILWRDSLEGLIKTYELSTVTYGTAPASFLAIRALQQLAIEERQGFPLASRIAREDFYVNDLLTGVSSREEIQQLRDEIIELLRRGGFHLRKWCSNEPSILEGSIEKSIDPHLYLRDFETQKTLGVYWHPRKDSLVHIMKPFNEQQQTTKRIMLSQIASLFDPLGLLGLIIVKAKILLQQLWENKLDWDESVPLHIATVWTEYKIQIEAINNFTIPRYVGGEDIIDTQLHGFADASERAYGAVLYVRSTNAEGNRAVHLVCSKTRVSPLKRLSLPRLELCAAVLLARLYGSELSDLANNRPLDAKSNILSLNPFLDANGILRVGGWLKHANVDFNKKHPVTVQESRYRAHHTRISFTKAIHLEIVSDLTTEAFLASLKRLFARRGKARAIYSDNATNFIGANNNLKEIFEFIQRSENQKIISRSLVDQGIQWYFAPPVRHILEEYRKLL